MAMTKAEAAQVRDWLSNALTPGMSPHFSPSGNSLALQPMDDVEHFMHQLDVHYADRREPTRFRHVDGDALAFPKVWASDDELIYYVSGEPLGTAPTSTLHALSTSGTSRRVMDCNETMSLAYGGQPNHLSVLSEPGGKPGIFDLDTRTGAMRRRDEFDTALDGLEIYPLFGHDFCPARQEVALIGWLKGDYLPEGVEPTPENSRWIPLLDNPRIQDYVSTRADGTTVTQRELTQEAKRKTPPRLFLLDASGKRTEVPGAAHTERPLWSPDGSVLSFERFGKRAHGKSKREPASAWVMRRDDLSLMRLGACSLCEATIMHPLGVLLCRLEDLSIPAEVERNRLHARSETWRAFIVEGGEVHAVS